VSESIAGYVLAHLERQVAQLGRPEVYLLDLMAWCLNSLTQHNRALPSSIARRASAVLRKVLSITHAHPADETFPPLVTALAFPDFVEAATDLERWLGEAPDAGTQCQILDTLVAMRSPRLLDVLIRLARSSQWRALQAQILGYIAAIADDGRLMRLPNDLNHVAYEAAIVRDIRFQRKGIRQIAVLANGASL
jgi:hypothetical protein